MSVDKTPTGVVYTVTSGAAGQQYPLTFPYINGVDVKAYYVQAGAQTSLLYGTHYTVVGQNFIASIVLPVGAKLAIYRQTDLTQEILWKDGQAVYTPDIMKADDKLTLIAQEISADMSRTVKLTREEEAAGGKPEDVVQSIYASRDAAAVSANVASAQATAAEGSAQAAANSASTAAQAVTTATEDAVSAATVQANSAHDSALAAAQSAADAAAASSGLAPRMDAVELKNTQQDTRLDAVEAKNTQQDTALLSKANTALDNISAAGKSAIAKACMPGNTTVNISLGGAYSTTYYWQNTYADGDISICFRCNLAAGWSAFMGVYNAQNGTARKASGGVYPSAVGADVWLTMRVKKGDYIGYNMYGCYPYAAFITYVDGES